MVLLEQNKSTNGLLQSGQDTVDEGTGSTGRTSASPVVLAAWANSPAARLCSSMAAVVERPLE